MPGAFSFFDPSQPVEGRSGNLPHWRQGEVTYFVTFRTADSIPREKILQWEEERTAWFRLHPEPHDKPTHRDYQERFPARLENGSTIVTVHAYWPVRMLGF